jgi:hypothetical protein
MDHVQVPSISSKTFDVRIDEPMCRLLIRRFVLRNPLHAYHSIKLESYHYSNEVTVDDIDENKLLSLSQTHIYPIHLNK